MDLHRQLAFCIGLCGRLTVNEADMSADESAKLETRVIARDHVTCERVKVYLTFLTYGSTPKLGKDMTIDSRASICTMLVTTSLCTDSKRRHPTYGTGSNNTQ